mgnify:CR=1 FL=1|jgi:serine/threonine protein kinase
MRSSNSDYTSSEYSTDNSLNSTENSTDYSSELSDDNEHNLKNLEGEILGNYNIIYELGRGGYSIVWMGYCANDYKYYAIKVQNSDDYEDGIDEIKIMKKLKHKYINRLKDYFIEKRYNNNGEELLYVCSVYELCCGNLDGIARKGDYKNGYPSKIVKKIYSQILEGLDYLHNKKKILHGDLKPDNILLKGYNKRDEQIIRLYDNEDFNKKYSEIKKKYWIDKGNKLSKIKKMDKITRLKIRQTLHKQIMNKILENNDINDNDKFIIDEKYILEPYIIITDFGNYCSDDEVHNNSFGTRYYQAPEIILKNDCTKKVDIWSLGCMLYELLVGKILFDPNSDKDNTTDSNHLLQMIEICGKFDKNYLQNCKNKNIYFGKKCKLKNSNNIKSISLSKLCNNIEDKEYWLNIINKCLLLNYNYRYKVNKLIDNMTIK